MPLEYLVGMLKRRDRAASVRSLESPSMLRWTFRRGESEIVCEVKVGKDNRSYGVHVTPDWARQRPITEVVSTPLGALQRHAEIAMQLREAGWSTSRRSL